MRIMGLDLGSRTLGIALSDPMGIVAQGYENYRFYEDDYENALMHVKEICDKMQIDEIVIGFPRHMNGDVSEKCEVVLEFKKRLEEVVNKKVITVDERLTTVIAHKRLIEANLSREKRKKVIDKMAAIEILQGYLDRRR